MNNNEVKIVNGSIVGIHLGMPMQDAIPEKPEDNQPYATELNTVTRIDNSSDIWNEQPTPSGGGASSWNDLKDKPFGEEQAFEPIVWDGNTDGLEFCGVTASADGVTQTIGYYKISDMFISYEDISLKTICSDYSYNNMEGQVVENAYETTLEDRKSDFSKEGEGWWFDPGNGGQIVMSDGTFVFGKGEPYEVTLSRGLWFQKSEAQMGEQVYKVYATAMLPDVTIKPMDEKYMPRLTSPSGKKFKLTVDDNGNITATEVT